MLIGFANAHKWEIRSVMIAAIVNDKKSRRVFMFSLFQRGGMFMYAILTVSIVSFALFCERDSFLYFRLQLNMEVFFHYVHFRIKALLSDGCLYQGRRPIQ